VADRKKPTRLPPHAWLRDSLSALWHRKSPVIAALSILAISVHLILRLAVDASLSACQLPLLATLVLGGIPFLFELFLKLLKREFGSDLLGGISIITSVLLGEYH
jgi:hypothetical protein